MWIQELFLLPVHFPASSFLRRNFLSIDLYLFVLNALQKTMWVFLKDVAVPYVNARLRKGFPLPVIRGFSLEDADISCSNSRIVVCSNVAYPD